ncbi:MAG: N-acetyltransferase [Planctomycetota bacterium]
MISQATTQRPTAGLDRVLRYVMEVDVRRMRVVPTLPDGFRFVPWSMRVDPVDRLICRHAAVKHAAFCDEYDADVFPCFRTAGNCGELMRRIVHRPNFLPKATWLVRTTGGPAEDRSDVGTIQGLRLSPTTGAVQNIGVVPSARGRGVGRALLVRALLGFRESGLSRVSLEVTATNTPAIDLYRDLGFRIVRTTERSVGR